MPKPIFDPSQPFEAVEPQGAAPQAKPKFDPSQPFEAGPSATDSTLRGLESGFLAGFPDEIAGGIEAAGQAFGLRGLGANNFSELELTKPKLFDGQDGSIKQAYVDRRDSQRAEADAARDANPINYHGAEIGGAIASGFIPGVAPARGASLANVAARSAAFGGAAGAGYSEADTLAGVAGDAAVGAVIGGAIPPALKGVGYVGGKAIGAAGNVAGKLGKATLSSLGGVSDDVIDRYMANPERIRKASSFDELYDEVTNVVNQLGDDLDNKNVNYDFAAAQLDEVAESIKASRVKGAATAKDQVEAAKAALDEAFKGRRQVIADKASPSRVEPMVTDALEGLKTRVNSGIEVAEEALAVSGESITTKSVLTPLRKLSTELGKDFSDDAVAAKGKVDKYIDRLLDSGEELPLTDARRFMKNIREDVGAWSRDAGGHVGIYDRSLKSAQGIFDKRIKGLSPEYDATMAGVADDMQVLDGARKLYGKDQTRLSRLEGAWRPSARVQREALEGLAEKQGGELRQAIDSMVDAQRTLKTPSRLEAIRKSLSETKALRTAEGSVAVAKQMAKPNAVKEAVRRSAEFQKMKSTKAQKEQAKQVFQKFTSFSEKSAEARLKQVSRGHRHARKTLQELSELSDRDFVEAVDTATDAAAFTKRLFHGSKNVNLFSMLGLLASTAVKGGAGAAGGFVLGGPVGLAVGAVIGAGMDQYGPRVTKKILDGIIKIKGPITEKAIQSFDVPEKVKLDLIQGLRNTLSGQSTSRTATTSLPRVASEDSEPQTVATTSPNKMAKPPLKGEAKWANDGLQKVIKANPALKGRLSPGKENKKINRLLIEASGLKPGSKAMDRVMKQLEEEA